MGRDYVSIIPPVWIPGQDDDEFGVNWDLRRVTLDAYPPQHQNAPINPYRGGVKIVRGTPYPTIGYGPRCQPGHTPITEAEEGA